MPFGEDILRYQDKYHALSNDRIPYRRDKTEDDRFSILTLLAVANEIEERGCYTNGVILIYPDTACVSGINTSADS